MNRSIGCLLALACAAPLRAQHVGLYYPEPPTSAFTVSRGVRFGTADTASLLMDVYRPTGARTVRPALVFHTYGAQRANTTYTSWARIAASKGLVVVLADLRVTAPADDFRRLLTHLTARGTDYGLDTAAIAVFGASSNGENVFSIAEDPAETRIKAAVIYYGGGAAVTQLRRDLPVLYVRAGLDRPSVNAGIDTLIARALAQNVPISVINYAGGHHGFDATDDNAVTGDVIEQTVDFVKRVTTPAYRLALASTIGYATAASNVMAGNFAAAAVAYADLVSRTPDDRTLRLSYGEALLGDRQFEKACAEFEKLKGQGLGPRDLGLPAARACLQKGDPDAAMAWLRSIPKRFLPPRVKDEAVFAPLRSRADFMALFQP